jgi:ankyrin repeat protein
VGGEETFFARSLCSFVSFQSGRTILHVAVLHGKANIIKFLYAKSAEIGNLLDLDAQDEDGNTPLILACTSRELQCVETLCYLKADIAIVNKVTC